jgi:uracil-DNA glycosylase
MPDNSRLLHILSEEVIACRRCPRLVAYREKVAREKRRAYQDWTYWGKPVPGFGDPKAHLLIVGLAPGAHGSNRTGRPFTGDQSGVFLYKALYDSGFANQPTALRRDDGLELIDSYITAAARCAPPDNKPLPSEFLNCREYLEREIQILKPRVVLALGKIAWDAYLGILKHEGVLVSRAAYPFAHGAEFDLPRAPLAGSIPAAGLGKASTAWAGRVRLFGAYHPSQQNTSTGKLTVAMYEKVLARIRRFLASTEGGAT